jgi:hypothetical protein
MRSSRLVFLYGLPAIMTRNLCLFVFVSLFVLFAGCGRREYEGEKRYPLSGSVTYDGEPIDGSIAFLPVDSKQRASGGAIVSGRYSVPEAQGANSGKHRIEIHWIKRIGEGVVDETAGGEMSYKTMEGLPPKFHQDSELTVEVPSRDHTYDFHLTSD